MDFELLTSFLSTAMSIISHSIAPRANVSYAAKLADLVDSSFTSSPNFGSFFSVADSKKSPVLIIIV